MDFSNYDLTALQANPSGIYHWGHGVLKSLTRAFGCEPPRQPTVQTFVKLRKLVNPTEEPHDNARHIHDILGPDAVSVTANWLERSGVMNSVQGSFWNSKLPVPKKVDAMIFAGTVAAGLLRRRNLTERLDSQRIGQIILPMSSRTMNVTEHPLVVSYINIWNHPPTEYEFCQAYVLPTLVTAGFKAAILVANSKVYEEVFNACSWLCNGTILAVGDAPNTIEGAGRLRTAGRRIQDNFDDSHQQLFMMGDAFPVARHQENAASYQDPISGLAQLARTAAALTRAVLD